MFNNINGLQMYFQKKKRVRIQLRRNVCIFLPNLIKYFSINGKQLHGIVQKRRQWDTHPSIPFHSSPYL
jgi:hypothetical protein